jgi:very-short-patch-repair endonuclease
LKESLTKTRSPNTEKLINLCGLKMDTVYECKEGTTIKQIMKVFSGETMELQYCVGDYRIDLYFPFHKLAIECDENNHSDRNINDEIKRQKFIEKKLGCKFYRYNPDDKNFDIFNMMNGIYFHLKK